MLKRCKLFNGLAVLSVLMLLVALLFASCRNPTDEPGEDEAGTQTTGQTGTKTPGSSSGGSGGGGGSVGGAGITSSPTITVTTQPTAVINVTEGSITGSLTVAASLTPSGTLDYQWFSNTSASNSGGTAIGGATGASYTIPTTLSVGTYYYYCVVSATGVVSKTTSVATINVGAASTNLTITISAAPGRTLTPIVDLPYTERTTTFTVTVSGFLNAGDASGVGLEINGSSAISGLGITNYGSGSYLSGTLTFTVGIECTNFTPFSSGSKTIPITGLSGLSSNYTYTAGQTTTVLFCDGEDMGTQAIPVNQDNIKHFNAYASSTTSGGLSKHYKLVEDVDLDPLATGANNWTAIGTNVDSFTGSFDGLNHTISNLTINAPSSDCQGMFGYISGVNCIVKNVGLLGGSISGGEVVGGVVGGAISNATVENCYSTCDVSGNGDQVGGVVGANDSTVSNCYATGDVSGNNMVGGVVGINGRMSGANGSTVSNCYATGDVSGNNRVGGVVGVNGTGAGANGSTVSNCYATGDISGNSDQVGGIVGRSSGGTVQNCVALNSSVSTTTSQIGRVIGGNIGMATVSNNYARSTGMTTSHSPIPGNVLDGDDITSADWGNVGWWTGTALFTDPWWSGKLPPVVP